MADNDTFSSLQLLKIAVSASASEIKCIDWEFENELQMKSKRALELLGVSVGYLSVVSGQKGYSSFL